MLRAVGETRPGRRQEPFRGSFFEMKQRVAAISPRKGNTSGMDIQPELRPQPPDDWRTIATKRPRAGNSFSTFVKKTASSHLNADHTLRHGVALGFQGLCENPCPWALFVAAAFRAARFFNKMLG